MSSESNSNSSEASIIDDNVNDPSITYNITVEPKNIGLGEIY